MAIEIVVGYPPNYKDIILAFPSVQFTPGVIYSWGKQIYNPDDIVLTPSLRSHENVHSQVQLLMGVEEWWDHYLKNVDFRFGQEVPAHHAEYKHYCALNKNPRMRENMLKFIAERLSGTLYGEMVSFEEARRLVRVGKT